MIDPTPPLAAALPQPVAIRERIPAMDVIRGVALFGILVVNMSFFGGPMGFAIGPNGLDGASATERAVWGIEATFFTGKFISLFSLLFGAGLALQMERMDAARRAARERGERPRSTAAMILRRLVILAAVGLAHALLIWYGDILFFYACLGWILIPARFLSARVLSIAALVLLVVSATCITGFGALTAMGKEMERAAATQPAMAANNSDDGTAIVEASEPVARTPMQRVIHGLQTPASISSPEFIEVEREIYQQGPFRDAVFLRAIQWAIIIPIMIFVYLPHILGLFLLGMVASRRGWFKRDAAAMQWRVLGTALPIGVLCTGVAALLELQVLGSGSSAATVFAGSLAEIGSVILCLGYAALICRVVYSGVLARSCQMIAQAGRMAFTIYLSESVLMTGLMYWWGLGRFDSFSRLQHLLIAFGTWVLLVLFAQLWLRYFRMGPLEWLWRMGTYLEVPPLRRRPSGRSADATEWQST